MKNKDLFHLQALNQTSESLDLILLKFLFQVDDGLKEINDKILRAKIKGWLNREI